MHDEWDDQADPTNDTKDVHKDEEAIKGRLLHLDFRIQILNNVIEALMKVHVSSLDPVEVMGQKDVSDDDQGNEDGDKDQAVSSSIFSFVM